MKAYSGKKYGNQIADFLKIHRGLFHTAMEEGGCEMHLIKLYFLKKENLDMIEVAYDSCEYLLRGLLVMETRFGKQPLSEDALEKVKAFRLTQEESALSAQIARAKTSKGAPPNSELQALIDAFRESAALSSWVLIRVMENNSAFFEGKPDIFESTRELLDAGMSHSEHGNERVASNCFSHAISALVEKNPELFQRDPEFGEAFRRLNTLQEEVITPLWDKYESEF